VGVISVVVVIDVAGMVDAGLAIWVGPGESDVTKLTKAQADRTRLNRISGVRRCCFIKMNSGIDFTFMESKM
jgi:hypothetical protein